MVVNANLNIPSTRKENDRSGTNPRQSNSLKYDLHQEQATSSFATTNGTKNPEHLI